MTRMIRFRFFHGLLALALLSGCAGRKSPEPEPASVTGPRTPYNIPLSTPGARFGGLPSVVQNTVRSEAGTAEIIDVRKESTDGRVFYKISFRDPVNFPPLYVGSDGSVLNPDLTVAIPPPQAANPEIKFTDLPATVRKAIQDRGAADEIAVVRQETWGDHTVYVVTFKDEIHHPKLYVLAEGTVLIQPTK